MNLSKLLLVCAAMWLLLLFVVLPALELYLLIKVGGLMGKSPKTIRSDKLAAEALRVLEDHAITSLVITDEGNRPIGVIHIHDILKAGITL